jgi:hypothetical protein
MMSVVRRRITHPRTHCPVPHPIRKRKAAIPNAHLIISPPPHKSETLRQNETDVRSPRVSGSDFRMQPSKLGEPGLEGLGLKRDHVIVSTSSIRANRKPP